MSVRFKTGADAPAVWRDQYKETIALAIDVSRPADEQWVVTIHEPDDATLIRMDFAREFEASHSISFLAASDDDNHSVLYRILCHFLRKTWPGGIEPS